MKKATGLFIVFGIIIIAIYDIYALINGGQSATISSILFNDSKVAPMIPLAFGVLIGHIFWGNQ